MTALPQRKRTAWFYQHYPWESHRLSCLGAVVEDLGWSWDPKQWEWESPASGLKSSSVHRWRMPLVSLCSGRGRKYWEGKIPNEKISGPTCDIRYPRLVKLWTVSVHMKIFWGKTHATSVNRKNTTMFCELLNPVLCQVLLISYNSYEDIARRHYHAHHRVEETEFQKTLH